MRSYHAVLNTVPCTCSIVIRKSIIRDLVFLDGASDQVLEQLDAQFQSKNLSTNEELSPHRYEEGLFGIVANGALKIQRWIDDDRYVVSDILTQGDFFLYAAQPDTGLAMYTYPDELQALTTTCVLTMNLSKLMPLLTQNPSLIPGFFAQMTGRIAAMGERFVRLMAFPAEHRVAWLLLFLHGKSPQSLRFPTLIQFNLTRKDLASMAGLSLETASRIIAAFERDGLITSGRGWIAVNRRDDLEALSTAAASLGG